jgi:predicted amidohydrolase YtcJ
MRQIFLTVAGILAVGLFLLAFSACAKAPPSSLAADTVLLNGHIITVDPQDSIVQAVAIKDGKILAVGSDKAIKALAGENTRVIDLKGRTATPGLIDSHAHFAGSGITLSFLDLDYPKVRKIQDMVEIVRAKVKTLPPGKWVIGKGWDEGKLAERRYVYARDIDPVTPDNPGWFEPTMGHYAMANSFALKLAGITKSTPDPPGGKIDRYPDGTPTGLLKESAMNLVAKVMPDFTREELQEGLAKMIEKFHQAGMTGVKDPGIGPGLWDLYQDAEARDRLNLRVFVLWGGGNTVERADELIRRIGPFTKPYISTGDDRLISGGVKLFLDGSGGGRTAWVYDEWNKNFNDVDKGNRGYPQIEPGTFQKLVEKYHDAGLHVSVHAIGDRAIDCTVDAYARALEKKPTRGLRHGLIHCNIPTDHAIETMARLQKEYDAGYPELQAGFMWWIGDTYAGNFGPERALRFMPLKTFLTKGMIWGGGSDFNVTPAEPRYGLWASMTRKPVSGTYGEYPYGRDHVVDIHAALRSYTIWSAHQLFLEKKTGSLEPGKYADIAVWDKDLYSCPVDEIKDMECQMTLFQGEVVYKKGEQ